MTMQIASAPGGKREAFTTDPYLRYGDRGNEDVSREMRRQMHRSWQIYFVTAPNMRSPKENAELSGKRLRGYITLPYRFRGPTGTGNGGYSAGMLVRFLGQSSGTVSLKAPPPLDTPLVVEDVAEDGSMIVARRPDSEGIILQATRQHSPVDLPTPPTLEQARSSSAGFVCHTHHPFPECFVCGIRRKDGLAIYPGAVGQAGLVATTWTPDASLPTTEGVLDLAVVWAALDCPGAFAAMGQTVREIVLAQMSASLNAPVKAGHEYLVMAWPVASEGRKERVASALLSANGEVIATASALWIAPRPPADAHAF